MGDKKLDVWIKAKSNKVAPLGCYTGDEIDAVLEKFKEYALKEKPNIYQQEYS